jgi:type IV pilus assembly protein PilW
MGRCAKSFPQADRRTSRYESGATLVELIIALAVGLVLLFGLSQIYLSSKQSYRLMDAQSVLMENGRFALETLSNELRLAGQQGCRRNAPLTVIANGRPQALLVPDTASHVPSGIIAVPVVSGEDDVSISAMPRIKSALSGTDTLTLISAEFCGGVLSSRLLLTNPRGRLQAGSTCRFDTGTPLMVANCESVLLFRAGASDQDLTQNVDREGGETNRLGALYRPGSELMALRSRSFFLRLNPAGQPALYRVDHVADTVSELVEGVENLQLSYGVDSTGDGAIDRIVGATAVSDWSKVVSVRVRLTLRSIEDRLLAHAREYTLDDKPQSDRRLVHEFATSVAIRNRVQ